MTIESDDQEGKRKIDGIYANSKERWVPRWQCVDADTAELENYIKKKSVQTIYVHFGGCGNKKRPGINLARVR